MLKRILNGQPASPFVGSPQAPPNPLTMSVMMPPQAASGVATDNIDASSLEESSEEITVQYIIDNKPPAKIVRDFFRENINAIGDDD